MAGPHEVIAVVTQPERRSGRGRKVKAPPVASHAAENDLPVLQPEKVGAPASITALERFDADIGVVVAFGQFLTRRVRELPRSGYLINAHASLLPRHRGAAPIAHAILSGDRETGVSIMRVEKEMDAGPVALVRKTEVRPQDDAGSLGERLAALAADGVAEALDRAAAGQIQWTEQDEGLATSAPKLSADDAELHFDRDAVEIELRVRALAPKPGAFTWLQGERLRILGAEAKRGSLSGATTEPGSVHIDECGDVRVTAATGWLRLTRVQRAGGVAQGVDSFQRGRGLKSGDRLGPSAAPEPTR